MEMEVLLGSKSPRRSELLKGAGIEFKLIHIEMNEDYPFDLKPEKVACFLALKKSDGYTEDLRGRVLITADTIVVLNGEVINKPEDLEDATKMLQKLSGNMHEVYTGVCLRTTDGKITFTDKTNVYFKVLDPEQIRYYVQNYHPLDKAGAYGIQDWIGYIGVEKIEGDFFNVMGLPVNRVVDALRKLCS